MSGNHFNPWMEKMHFSKVTRQRLRCYRKSIKPNLNPPCSNRSTLANVQTPLHMHVFLFSIIFDPKALV